MIETRGRALLDGSPTARIHRQEIPVGARVEDLCGFSGPDDVDEIFRWLGQMGSPVPSNGA